MSYQIQKMRAKLHNGVVTAAFPDYEGSVTLGKTLMEASGIEDGERVQVLNINNGNRIETYVITGKHQEIYLNGAAAHQFQAGDRVIVIAYAFTTRHTGEFPQDDFVPVKVILDGTIGNNIKEIL